MKLLILSFISLFTITFFAQEIHDCAKEDYLIDLQKLEMKSGAKKLNFKRNPNTDNYDLKYHRLEWSVNPAASFISGNVTSYFEALSDMNTITFDLSSNMNVSSVLQRGNPLNFSQNTNDELIITLPVVQNTGVLDSLTVSYNGNPASSGFGSFETSTHNGIPVLWTLSEPYGAKAWWPCKQDLNDKIDNIDIFVDHESQYKAASNGLLISENQYNGTNTITHWQHNYKIPAYLIAIAVTNYEVYTNHVTNGNFDVVNYVYPEDLAYTQTRTTDTPPIMDLFGSLFEMYPFADEKYGHAQFGWGGGMEHTTMTFMGSWSRGLIAHELAHQWFGNKVTCGSWEDIWLNEGFATYLSALVIENFDGTNAFKNWRESTVLTHSSRAITSQPNGSVFVSDTTSVGRIFSSRLSYNKGAMVLHMLRYKLGDATFFQAVKNYLADPALAYGYANTIDLQNHLEAVSGESLTEYFNDWFIGEGHPSFDVSWNYDLLTQRINLRVNQTQSHNSVSFFETPLPIKINGPSGQSELIRFELTQNGQLFSEPIGFNVTSIEVDPDIQLISNNNTTVLGTENFNLESSFLIYPNPVENSVTIKNNNHINIENISIYNMLGQQVLSKNEFNKTISLESLEKGVYTIKINTELGLLFKTIIKK